jgi:hypothetical protein
MNSRAWHINCHFGRVEHIMDNLKSYKTPGNKMKTLGNLVAALALLALTSASFAGPLAVFNSWTMLANDEGVGNGGWVNPGYGGQNFDAEYLFYKIENNQLSIGLQTGFDIINQNGQTFSGMQYYTGDLALSFDGSKSNYEYAIDFGNLTKGYNSNQTISAQGVNVGTGVDAAGLYKATSWNNDIYYGQSAPYGMSAGSMLVTANAGNFQEGTGISGTELSFYNIFSFDLSNIVNVDKNFILDAHWTMSCGNDALDGRANVPEPGSIVLLLIGLLGLLIARRKI